MEVFSDRALFRSADLASTPGKPVYTRAQPPVQDPDTLPSFLKSNRDSPEIATSVNEPLRIVASSLRCKAVESVVPGVHVQVVTCLIQMRMGVNLILNSSFDDFELLFDISREAVQRRLCLVEERHDGVVVRGSDCGAEGGVAPEMISCRFE